MCRWMLLIGRIQMTGHLKVEPAADLGSLLHLWPDLFLSPDRIQLVVDKLYN